MATDHVPPLQESCSCPLPGAGFPGIFSAMPSLHGVVQV